MTCVSIRSRAGRLFSRLGVVALLLLSACATPGERAQSYARHGEWLKSVIVYRKAVHEHPNNIRYQIQLRQFELKAAIHYDRRGRRDLQFHHLNAAIEQFKEGLVAMPGYRSLAEALNRALARKRAQALTREAVRMERAGRLAGAEHLYRRAIRLDPSLEQAMAAYRRLTQERVLRQNRGLALTSRAPITLNFNETNLRTAFRFIAKSFGVNVIFDTAVQNVPVTLFAQDVTFDQALSLLLTTNKDFYKQIGPNTIIIVPDTKEKRGQYDNYLVESWQLNAIKAQDMANILKDILHVKNIYVNTPLNTIIVRDTRKRLHLVRRLVAMNDIQPAEVILDVEILEVDYTKARQLGLDLGSYSVSAFSQSTNGVGGIPLSGSVGNAIRDNAVLTLPTVTFRFFKQDVDAKTLANPQIRVLNGETADIHVGDRVPLRSSSILDPTGQVTTTYNYTDTGVKLTVKPMIHMDSSVTVKLSLDVSSLGQNLGTSTEPAYMIGTRDANSYMLLRDGETAILGGLIRSDSNNGTTRVPLLGDIPFFGALFTSYDQSHDRTEVLLTITPHVVRGWHLTPRNGRLFYSGTAHHYFDRPLFAKMALPGKFNAWGQAGPVAQALPIGQVPAAANATAPGAPTLAPPLLTFGQPIYTVKAGQTFRVQVKGRNLDGRSDIPVHILFNPAVLQFVRAQAGDFVPQSLQANAQTVPGQVHVRIAFAPGAGPKGHGILATLVLQAVKPGISYLICQTPTIGGGGANVQVRAARVVVQ